MKLKDRKLSELRRLCEETPPGFCSQTCPLWDKDNGACCFTLPRLPCQWEIEDGTDSTTEVENPSVRESD